MPLYEYRCDPCDSTFETLVRGSGDVPHCPECGGIDLAKQFSVPGAPRVSGGPGSASLPVCHDTGGGPSSGCGAGGCGSGICGLD